MANEIFWTFLVSSSPLLIAGVVGSILCSSFYFYKRLRTLRGTLLVLLPGAILTVLSILGCAVVFWQAHNLVSNFNTGSIGQIASRQDELVNLVMGGRYVELGEVLDGLRKDAHLSELSIVSSDGQLLAQVPSKLQTGLGDEMTISLKRQDLDGTAVSWGSLKYRPDLHSLSNWAEGIRRKWTIMAIAVVSVVILFGSFVTWLLHRRMRGLFQTLEELKNKVGIASTPNELADLLKNQVLVNPQLTEEVDLNNSLSNIAAQIVDLHRRTLELAIDARIGRTIAQVVHDIRSPMSLINVISENTEGISESNSKLLKMAFNRLNMITADLLMKFKSRETHEVQSSVHLPLTTIEQIVSEKKAIHATKNADIIISLSGEVQTAFIDFDSRELGRVLSNIMENAIEATTSKVANINIDCSVDQNFFIIRIQDNGPGIPKEILTRLGSKGVTFGKSNGNGLGVFHAKEFMESSGGKFQILSELGIGTTVQLTMPLYRTI